MVEEEIANGRLNISYDVFAGYQSPHESVRRPLPKEEMQSSQWLFSRTDVHPVQVEIPNGLRGIGAGAFENCVDLTAVSIPDSMREIGSRAFSGCVSLTRVDIPNRVYWIGEAAFFGCTALTAVSLPACPTKIGDRAFQAAPPLRRLSSQIRWRKSATVPSMNVLPLPACMSLRA